MTYHAEAIWAETRTGFNEALESTIARADKEAQAHFSAVEDLSVNPVPVGNGWAAVVVWSTI